MRSEDGKFGDQKYLDDWLQRFESVVVLQHKGAGLAPWNAAQYSQAWKEGRFTVDGAHLIFFHFHGFNRITKNVVRPAELGYLLSFLLIKYLYFPYVYALQEAERELGDGDEKVPRKRNSLWLWFLPGLLEQRWLLVSSKKLALAFWRFGERQNNRLLTGIDAFRRGDLKTARRMCFLSVLRNPFDLFDRQILYILASTTLKPGQMAFFQRLRGRV
jgi:hypothetical protein